MRSPTILEGLPGRVLVVGRRAAAGRLALVMSTLVFVLVVGSGAVVWGSVPVQYTATGGPPMGLMLQIESWSKDAGTGLSDYLNYICTHNHPGTQPGAINSLVVMDIATPDTSVPLNTANPGPANDALDTTRLAELLPFFPGGNGSCQFPNVYVGTVDFSNLIGVELHQQGGHPYHDEFENATMVSNMVGRDGAVAAAFKTYVSQNVPGVSWDWYVTQEALLDYFTNSNGSTFGAAPGFAITDGTTVEQAVLSFLVQYTNALSGVVGGKHFLWSPGFAQPSSALFGAGGGDKATLDANLKAFFSGYQQQVASSDPVGGSGPLIVDFQDHVGSEGWSRDLAKPCRQAMDPVDAVAWYQELQSDFTGSALEINIEQFRQAQPYRCQNIKDPLRAPGYGAVLTAREDYYAAQGLALGPSFDLSSWTASNRSNRGEYYQTQFVNTTTAAGSGGSNVVSATLQTSDGLPLTNAPVALLQCDTSGGSCEQPVNPDAYTTTSSSTGVVSITEPAPQQGWSGTSYWRLSLADSTTGSTGSGSTGWLASESPVVSTKVTGTAWSSVSASPAAVGGSSTVRGVLAVAGGGPVSGASAQLVSCGSASSCSSPTPVGSPVTSGSDGSVSVSTPALSSVPAFFEWQFAGGNGDGPSNSPIITVQTQTQFTGASATAAGIGGSSTVSGTLSVAGGPAVSGGSVQLLSCPNAYGCTNGTPVGSPVATGSNGSVSISTGSLSSVPAYFALQYVGDAAHASVTSAVITVAGVTGWVSTSATPAPAGGTSVVTGKLVGAGSSSGVSGAGVTLGSCSSSSSCSSPSQVGAAQTTGSDGTVSMTTPGLSTVPAYVQWNWPGNSNDAASNSSIVTIQAQTALTGLTAIPAGVGSSSTVTATLGVPGSNGVAGWGVGGASMVLIACPSATSCVNGTQVGTATSDSSGKISISTGNLTQVPTWFQVQWAGNPNYGPSTSPIITLAGATAWGTPTASAAPVGGTSTITATISIQGGGPLNGATVHLISCPNATTNADGTCAGGTDTGQTVTTSSNGVATFTTPTLVTLPADYQLTWPGNTNYAGATTAVVTVSAATAWSKTSAGAAAVGASSAVTGTLSTAATGSGTSGPVTGAAVTLYSCPSATTCSGGSPVRNASSTGTSTTDASGLVIIPTGPQSILPAYYQLQSTGTATDTSATSPIITVQAATAFTSVSGGSASVGGSSTVRGVLAVAGGGPVSGASVQLVSCGSATDCSNPTAVGPLVGTGSDGSVSEMTPGLSSVPAWFEWQFAGGAGDGPSNSPIIAVQAATQFTGGSATAAGVGSSSTVSGVLSVAGGSALAGGSVQLLHCQDAYGCTTGATLVGSPVPTASDGSVAITSDTLTSVPAYYALQYLGDGGHASVTSAVITIAGATGWVSTSATPAPAGGTSRVIGKLVVAGSGSGAGNGVQGAPVVLNDCGPAPTSCGSTTQMGPTQTTSPSDGSVSMTTPALGTVPEVVQWSWAGSSVYAASTSSPITIQAQTQFTGATATPAGQGSSSTVTATLAVPGSNGVSGWGVGGGSVTLWSCGSATDCTTVQNGVTPQQVGTGTTDGSGKVSISTGTLSAVPAFFQLRWAGNPNYGSSTSVIITLAGATAWNTPSASPAPVGGTSTITATISVQGGGALNGATVHLIKCNDATTNPDGTCTNNQDTGLSVTTSSNGVATLTTPTTTTFPAYYQLQWPGNTSYAKSVSTIAVVAATTTWASTSTTAASPGYNISGTLKVQGGGAVTGASVNLIHCTSTSPTSCTGAPAGTATTNGIGVVTINTGTPPSHPAYYQLQWPGNPNYAPTNSTIITTQ